MIRELCVEGIIPKKKKIQLVDNFKLSWAYKGYSLNMVCSENYNT